MKRVILAFALGASVVVLAGHSASAEVYQCGTYGSKFDGWIQPYTPPTSERSEGTSSVLTVHRGSVCDTDTSSSNFVFAWTMISDQRSGVTGYAQSGFFRWYGSSMYHTTEYKQDTAHTYVRKICLTCGALIDGETNQYWEQYVTSCSCLRLNVDVTILDTTPFNPYSTWVFPFRSQYYGETKYLESDMPGYLSAPTDFRSMQIQHTSTHTWTNVPCDLLGQNDNTTRWGSGADLTCIHGWIYTK